MDYSFFYRETLGVEDSWEKETAHGIFISAYNSSERVKIVFDKVHAKIKHWLIFPEYRYVKHEFPNGQVFECCGDSESEQIISFFRSIDVDLSSTTLCIDITGFMRPQLAFLLKFLYVEKVQRVDLIYSEPTGYKQKEKTSFSDGNVTEVRQIEGFEGLHSRDNINDLLLIGSGYDHHLIKRVCNHKENAKILQLIGFPSLRPDMYQENILKTAIASDALGNEAMRKPLFAPANDPFVTAEVLSNWFKEFSDRQQTKETSQYTNLYLCPLSTKPQTVGFILFYLFELQDKPASILYPFFNAYERETSVGINKALIYTVEFPMN